MMNDGSRHDPGRAAESESIPEVMDRPGWFARVGSRVRRAWRLGPPQARADLRRDRDRRTRLGPRRPDRGAHRPESSPDGDGDRAQRSGPRQGPRPGAASRTQPDQVRRRAPPVREMARHDRETLGAPRGEHRGHRGTPRRTGHHPIAARGGAGVAAPPEAGPEASAAPATNGSGSDTRSGHPSGTRPGRPGQALQNRAATPAPEARGRAGGASPGGSGVAARRSGGHRRTREAAAQRAAPSGDRDGLPESRVDDGEGAFRVPGSFPKRRSAQGTCPR